MHIGKMDERGWYIAADNDGIKYLYSDGEIRPSTSAAPAAGVTPFWPTKEEAERFIQVWKNPEMLAVRDVVKNGTMWGYGNMIDRLKMAWALSLWESGMSLENAAISAGMDPERLQRSGEKETVISMKEYIGMIS